MNERQQKHRPFILGGIFLIVGTFVITALLTGVAVYAILGRDGVKGSGIVVLVLVPLIVGLFAAKLSAYCVFKSFKDRLSGRVFSFVVKLPFAKGRYEELVQRGICLCVHCGHVQFGAPPACLKCGKPFDMAGAPPPPSASKAGTQSNSADLAAGNKSPRWREIESELEDTHSR